MLKPLLLAAAAFAAAVALPASAQSIEEQARFAEAQTRFQSELARFQDAFDRYRAAQQRDRGNGYYARGGTARVPYPSYNARYGADAYDRDETGSDPAPDYRPGAHYQQRVLRPDQRATAGADGRHYCNPNNGPTSPT